MKALFGRKITDLKELKELTEEALKAGREGTDYEVTKEIELSDEEFKLFSKDFLKDQPWITEEDGGPNKNGQLRCIRVKNKVTGEKVLVNSEGYTYPRYTALELD
jgi:hypothetical protein